MGDLIDRIRHPRGRRSKDRPSDIERHARPSEKPRRDAQWNEAAGRWEVWHEGRGAWIAIDDGTVQAPATPSAEPTDDWYRRPRP